MKSVEELSEKKKNILAKAEKVLADKGFEGASVREIARSAGVNIAMISYYFGSKEKMFEEIMKIRLTQSQAYVNGIISDTGLNEFEKLSRIIDGYVDRVQAHQDFYKILLVTQITTKNKRILAIMKQTRTAYLTMMDEIVQAGFKKGVFTKQPDSFLLQSALNGIIYFALQSKALYKEYKQDKSSMAVFDESYFGNFRQQLKTIFKDLLGYENK